MIFRRLIFSFLFPLLLTSNVIAASECSSLFADNPLLAKDYRSENRTAKQDWNEYQQPNSRNLTQYNSILNTRLETQVRKGSLMMDLGGGKGLAGFQLAELTGAQVIVVNTQSPLDTPKPKRGKYKYISGWAEEVLVKYDQQVDVITDVWGAFSYSPAKIDMLKAIFKALKPGGKAFILYHPFKTTTKVIEKEGGSPVFLDNWLSSKFPKLIHTENSKDWDYGSAIILTLTKPEDGSVKELDIPLKLISYHYSNSERNTLPESFYGPLDYQ